jgi:hypothetical protein
MRLLKYFSYSGLDEKTNKFRCMHIKLVKQPEAENELHDIIKYVKNKYGIEDNIFQLVEELNRKLKLYYKGQFKFDFTLVEGIDIKNIKIYNKLEDKIKILMFESNDKLAKIQRKIESK